MGDRKAGIGGVLAPWPFLWFGAVAIAGAAAACPLIGWVRGYMTAFDVASLVFAVLCLPLFKHRAQQMREAAEQNDANRGILLLIASMVTGVILVSIGTELSQKGRPRLLDVSLIVVTLSLCWLFSTLVFCMHYAHLFYKRSEDDSDAGGLCFPETEEPDYWDFFYFSSCLAMTFQTSDVDITTGKFRRTVVLHTLGAFVFNIGVVAFSINILGGG